MDEHIGVCPKCKAAWEIQSLIDYDYKCLSCNHQLAIADKAGQRNVWRAVKRYPMVYRVNTAGKSGSIIFIQRERSA